MIDEALSRRITELADEYLANEQPEPPTFLYGMTFSHLALVDTQGNIVATFPVEVAAVSGGSITFKDISLTVS